MPQFEVRGRPQDFEAFAHDEVPPPVPPPPRRIDLSPDKVEKGLTQLVLSLLEMIRQLVERQAMRRIDGGGLSDDQIEKLGDTLMRLERQMRDLRAHFQIDSLDIDLGPLGSLVDEER